MTASNAPRRPTEGQRPVYGEHGETNATVTASRSNWMGSLLAECERGHVYVLPGDVKQWLAAEAACPRCRALGQA